MKFPDFFRNAYKKTTSAMTHVALSSGSSGEREVMGQAVGGSFDAIGYIEKALLIQHGLNQETDLIDVGCGSGRLLSQLNAGDVRSYLGTDISSELLDYAGQFLHGPGWNLQQVDGCRIPGPESCCDMVCMFSVITHLLHQESYLYFLEVSRVLRQGGKAVVSFLEFRHPGLWPIFESSVDVVLGGERLDMFVDRDALSLWADHAGLAVLDFIDGETAHIPIEREVVFENGVKANTKARLGPTGQSVVILQKK